MHCNHPIGRNWSPFLSIRSCGPAGHTQHCLPPNAPILSPSRDQQTRFAGKSVPRTRTAMSSLRVVALLYGLTGHTPLSLIFFSFLWRLEKRCLACRTGWRELLLLPPTTHVMLDDVCYLSLRFQGHTTLQFCPSALRFETNSASPLGQRVVPSFQVH